MKGDFFMKKYSKRNKEGSPKGEKSFKRYIIFVLKNFLVFIILFFISGFIIYKTGLNRDYYYLVSLATALISSFISGFSYSAAVKEKGMLNGILSVLPLLTAIEAVSLILSELDICVRLPIAALSIILSIQRVAVNHGKTRHG